MKRTIFFIMLLSLLPSTYAWGVAFAHDHFVLKQGEIQNVSFFMQNYVESDTKRIIVELSGDSEIATIINKKEYYLLPPKTTNHKVVISLKIPEQAQKKYEIDVNFIAHSLSGGVGISTAKVIPITIDVPDGTIEPQQGERKKELDLAKIYDELEEQKQEEREEETPNDQSTGMMILKNPASLTKSLKILLAGLIVVISLIVAVNLFLSKRRKRELEL